MDLAGLRGDSASVPQVDDVSRARYEQQHREKRDKDHLPAMEPPPEPTKRMKCHGGLLHRSLCDCVCIVI